MAKSAKPKVSQTKGRKMSFTMGRTRRERAVRTAPATISSLMPKGTEKPEISFPARKRAKELIVMRIMTFPKKFILEEW